MKNVLLKYGYYDEYGFFSHVYYVDCDYSFNEKNVNEIIEFVMNEPLNDVLIHTNDLSHEIIELVKEISNFKKVWLQTQTFLFEDFAVMKEETLKILGFDKIDVMIDALGDIIDVKKSLKEEKLVEFNKNASLITVVHFLFLLK